MASGVVSGARAPIAAVERTARGDVGGSRSANIPQPTRSQAHNLAAEREFVPLRVHDPALHEGAAILRCEHFAEYGSRYHALSCFRGNANLPRVLDPILAALRELDVVRALGTAGGDGTDGDPLGLHWKLTLNHYKPRAAEPSEALAEAGGALFPWHTDLAANGEMTMISTLLAPATPSLRRTPIPPPATCRRAAAAPGSPALSGPARWDWCTAQCRIPTRPARSASRSCSAARPRRPPSRERAGGGPGVPGVY